MSDPPQSRSDCGICRDIWRRFVDPASTQAIRLGSPEEALSTQCSAHRPLVQGFADYLVETKRRDSWLSGPGSGDIGIDRSYGRHSVRLRDFKCGLCWDLHLVHKDSPPAHAGIGRILDQDWVDLDIVKRWKTTCLSSHGAKCENPVKIWPTRPAWLVDVERRCLVPGRDAHGSFVALSYTWGSEAVFALGSAALSTLQEPGALSRPDVSETLPPIVSRAMYLTSVIGERYLWTDVLCIAHHDQGAMNEQLAMMGAIYATAVVTIIAVDGDSRTGLLGLQGISGPRELKQRVIAFGDQHLIVRGSRTLPMSSARPYCHRGWTFQEYEMSKRRILFQFGQARWECRCSVWHEELMLGAYKQLDVHIDTRLSVILAGFPDLASFNGLISRYNRSQLRYDEDALPAISGLLSVASRSFTGGFLYGIPEMFFERGLGWGPISNHVNLRRRVRSDRAAAQGRLSPSGLPSWSWVGWHGAISGGDGEATRINDRRSNVEETMPITEWYTGHDPTDPPSQRRRIRATWFENRDRYKDLTEPLPPGWSRHRAPNEPRLYPEGCGKHVFKHAATPDPDKGSKDWYYPFPVQDIRDSTLPSMPEQSPYLFCETASAILWGYQAGDGNLARLCNHYEETIGMLHLHNEESLALFPEGTARGAGLPIEAIAVYKTRVYSKTWNPQRKTYHLPQSSEERFAVLWIEWKGGVAYRRAGGWVRAAAWEMMRPKTISLLLG